MARSIRNESDAHAALAQHAQTRADWRAVLAARDAKRAARRVRSVRTARRHSAGFAHLLTMLCIVGFALLTMAAAASLALHALESFKAPRQSCDSPILRADSRAEVVSMVDCE